MFAEMCCEGREPSLNSCLSSREIRVRHMGPIVIIDDNPTWSEAVIEFLGAEGFTVETAESGRQGLELLDRIDPVLIILDVNLPDTNGLSVLREYRRRNKTSPVLMVSAEDQSSVMAEALSEGAASFLRKPVSPELLVRAVRQLTRDRSR